MLYAGRPGGVIFGKALCSLPFIDRWFKCVACFHAMMEKVVHTSGGVGFFIDILEKAIVCMGALLYKYSVHTGCER